MLEPLFFRGPYPLYDPEEDNVKMHHIFLSLYI